MSICDVRQLSTIGQRMYIFKMNIDCFVMAVCIFVMCYSQGLNVVYIIIYYLFITVLLFVYFYHKTRMFCVVRCFTFLNI